MKSASNVAGIERMCRQHELVMLAQGQRFELPFLCLLNSLLFLKEFMKFGLNVKDIETLCRRNVVKPALGHTSNSKVCAIFKYLFHISYTHFRILMKLAAMFR